MTQHDPYVDVPEPPLTSPERVVGEQVPYRQRGRVSSRPQLPIRYIFLPGGRNRQVADFWSGIFVGQATLEQFQATVRDCIQRLQYDEVRLDGLSFSGGLVGVERDMLLFNNGRGAAGIYFKLIGGFHYVSLRVYYAAPLSILKLLGLILFSMAAVVVYDSGLLFNLSYYRYYSYSFDRYLLNLLVTPSYWFYVLAFFIGLYLVLGIISWIRTGSFNQFMAQNFNELYRDDLASIGEIAYSAIHTAVDHHSLQAVLPKQENPPPAFGARMVTANSKRRI